MKKTLAVLVCAGAALMLFSTCSGAQTADELFHKGVQLEEMKGELEQAIEAYKSVVRKYPTNVQLGAQSLLRMGRCYEKLGKDEAKKAYEKIVNDYAGQREAVAEARARLSALRAGTKTGASPRALQLLALNDSAFARTYHPRVIAPSPDGRRIAYAQWGDTDGAVYVRDLGSGEIRKVVDGQPAVDNHWSVIWSKDGKRLAFRQLKVSSRANTIKILELASGETGEVPGLDAQDLFLRDWSRDGRSILCSHAGRNTLELVSVATGSMTTLSDSISVGQRATFSPDGRFVAYAAGKMGDESLYTQSVTGGQRHRIVGSSDGWYLHPLWSPDGHSIAYQNPDGIWLMPVAEGIASGPPCIAYRTTNVRWPLAWTESGGLYLTYFEERWYPKQVSVDPATGGLRDTVVRDLPYYEADAVYFAWSPDMRQIVFTGWPKDITIAATDGGSKTSHRITEPDVWVNNPWWSSDGNEVLYDHYDPAGRTVRALNVKTGAFRELFPKMKSTERYAFSLNAENSLMTYGRRGADSGSVELVVAKTGEPDGRVLAAAPGPDGSRLSTAAWPRLSPRGDQVSFVRQIGREPRDAGPEAAGLWVIGSDGRGLRRVTTAPFVRSTMWSPGGTFIAYLSTAPGGENVDLRVVEVATGIEKGKLQLPQDQFSRPRLADWSKDGRYIGVTGSGVWWELWVVEGLQAAIQ